ncbi:MAG: ABC transporter substrate-binding protein [Deltaproteobacteria bacterium]|nr:ABC transporter substrate-binding protein [Deltaproteobacteria bacterium]
MQDARCRKQEVRSKRLEKSSRGRYCLLILASCLLLLIAGHCSLLTETAFSEELSSPSAASDLSHQTFNIGVVLPLSGRYAHFGEQALKGILLAADIFELRKQWVEGAKGQDNTQIINVEIIIKDTKDDPIASEKAVEELALSGNVVGVIGPLLSITAIDGAKKAQELKVPTITLSQKEGLTNAGQYIFRNFLLPSEQAKTIASYAINKLNYKKFALLYPNSPYGIELANLFKQEVKKNNGEIAAEEQYREGQTYFGKEIVRLFKIKETEKKEGRRKIKIFETAVAVDAIYIPDYFDTIGLIAPHFAYYNIKDIKLIGSNGWNSPKLIEMAGKYVEGSIFIDGFFSGSKRDATSQFVNNFRNLYDTEPGIIEAQAYDAVRMMIEAVKKNQKPALEGFNQGAEVRSLPLTDVSPVKGRPPNASIVDHREDVRVNLANLRGFPGATGNITFDSNREAVKTPFILEIKKGKIVEVK